MNYIIETVDQKDYFGNPNGVQHIIKTDIKDHDQVMRFLNRKFQYQQKYKVVAFGELTCIEEPLLLYQVYNLVDDLLQGQLMKVNFSDMGFAIAAELSKQYTISINKAIGNRGHSYETVKTFQIQCLERLMPRPGNFEPRTPKAILLDYMEEKEHKDWEDWLRYG